MVEHCHLVMARIARDHWGGCSYRVSDTEDFDHVIVRAHGQGLRGWLVHRRPSAAVGDPYRIAARPWKGATGEGKQHN